MILGNLLLTSRLKNITIYSAAELKYSIMLLKKGTPDFVNAPPKLKMVF